MASIQERSPEYDVDVLNGLIETTLDSVDGYEAAAQDARDPRFATMFSTRAVTSSEPPTGRVWDEALIR